MTTLKFLVDTSAPNAEKTFGDLKLRLDDLDRNLSKTREIGVTDKQAAAALIRTQLRADRLRESLKMDMSIKGAVSAEAKLLTIEATADRVDSKLSKASEAGGRGGLLGRITGLFGAGGPVGAVGRAFTATGLGGTAAPAAIGTAVAAGAAVAPAAIPFALGTGLGGLGAILTDPKGLTGILKTMMSEIKTALAPLKPLFSSVLGTLPGIVKQLAPGLRDVFAYSVPYLKAFVGLIDPVAKIILPAIARILREMLPSLPTMSKSLLDIAQGFAMFLNALGPRGIQASAKIFEVLAVTIEAGLAGSGAALNAFAVTLKFLWNVIGTGAKYAISAFEDFARVATRETRAIAAFVAPKFDELRHHVANIFDGMRHDIANVFDIIRHIIPAAWDAIWNSTSLKNTRGVQEIRKLFGDMQHGIASTFDTVRHVIASAWDTIWNNTIGRVRRGIDDVVGWFRGLPGRILGAFKGIGTSIYNEGHFILTEFWNGLKSVATGIGNWFKNFGHTILHIIDNILGPFHSPSQKFYNIGRDIMLGLRKGVIDHTRSAVQAMQGSAHQVANAGSGVQRWAPLVRRALAMEGLSPGLAGNVLFQMTTESGGNPNAINLTDSNAAAGDPSRGLMQTIMSTFRAYHWPGTSWNIYDPLANIAAALNYAKHVYGPQLANQYGGIGSGRGYALGTPSAMAGWAWVGERGPELVRFRGGEQVTPAAQRGGRLVHVENMYVREPEDVALVASKLSFKITASGFG